ncbi:unnamed protein product [Paramecium sonneborni]|uniref:Uncharacterized protein n=1 Tax=Paramecium sonneborni TaxID=65129 RepID=A0A8S1PIC2_9CILI|nr:unnamed protein product [Paramecium sonneborni]
MQGRKISRQTFVLYSLNKSQLKDIKMEIYLYYRFCLQNKDIQFLEVLMEYFILQAQIYMKQD